MTPIPKPWTIVFRPAAQTDLQHIIAYIAQDNLERAYTFADEIRTHIGHLAETPKLGREGRRQGTRELVVHSNYIVVYRLRPRARRVEVLAIKHAAQQYP